MKKSITIFMSCAAALFVCQTGQAQDGLGGVISSQTNAGVAAQSGTNSSVQAGLQNAANAALNGQDVRGSIQQGLQGAIQNESNRIQGNLQGNVQGTTQGNGQSESNQNGLQGSIQSNGQLNTNQNGQQGVLQSNGRAGLSNSNSNGQLRTQGNANLQTRFSAQTLENVKISSDGRLQLQGESNSELMKFGFQSNDQVVDANGRVITNAKEIAELGEQNGQFRVVRNGQIVTINSSTQTSQHHPQGHDQNQTHGQEREHDQKGSGSRASASVMAKLNKIDELVREVRSELNGSQR